MLAPKLRFKRDDGSDYPEWISKQISDFANCFSGATPSTAVKEYWNNGTISWLSSGEINKKQIFETDKKISQLGYDKCSAKIVKPNSVVIALAGQGKTRGTVAITRVPVCTNQSICAIETDDSVDDVYLYQFLGKQYNNLRNISSGDGTRGGLNLKLINNYFVSIPCLEEQQKIADFLSTVDEIIAQSNAEIASLEQQKKAAMQKIFSQQVRFKREDGGNYPKWKRKKIDDIFELITDYVAAGSFADIAKNVKYQSSGYAQLVRTVDLKNGFTSKEEVFVSEEAFKYLWKVNLDKESIVLPNVGNCGEVYYITPDKLPSKENVLAPNAILVRSTFENNLFLSFVMSHKSFQEQLKLIVSPSGQTKFNKTDFKSLILCIPCLEEQNKIADFLSAYDEAISCAKQELAKWKELKKGLLQQMFV